MMRQLGIQLIQLHTKLLTVTTSKIVSYSKLLHLVYNDRQLADILLFAECVIIKSVFTTDNFQSHVSLVGCW